MGLFSSDPAPAVPQTTSSSSSASSSNVPYQQPAYQQLLGQADNLYNQGMPQYYGGATVAGFTPAQLESMNLSSNWVTGGAQDMMANQNQQYQQMMSGRVNTGEGSPYADMANTYRQQATDQANQLMGNVRGGQVMSGQSGGSSRGDLLNNQVITDTTKNLNQNLSGMYNNAYNQAQATQNNALGQYGNMMNMPMQMSQGLYNQVGLPQQQMNQNVMNDAKQRYDYNSMNPWKNLGAYQGFIGGNMGSTQYSNSSGSSTGPGGAPVEEKGGLNIGSLIGGVAGAYFGGPAGAAAGAQAGGMIFS